MNEDLINYVLTEAQANIKFQIESLDVLRKEANATLTLLMTGAGAASGYGIKLCEDIGTVKSDMIIALFSLALFLFFLSGLLSWFCLLTGDVMPPSNIPANLYNPDFNVYLIKEAEIENMQGRIETNRGMVANVGSWLNIVRIVSLFSPLIFLVVWAVE